MGYRLSSEARLVRLNIAFLSTTTFSDIEPGRVQVFHQLL
jgi:hypothetical protein